MAMLNPYSYDNSLCTNHSDSQTHSDHSVPAYIVNLLRVIKKEVEEPTEIINVADCVKSLDYSTPDIPKNCFQDELFAFKDYHDVSHPNSETSFQPALIKTKPENDLSYCAVDSFSQLCLPETKFTMVPDNCVEPGLISSSVPLTYEVMKNEIEETMEVTHEIVCCSFDFPSNHQVVSMTDDEINQKENICVKMSGLNEEEKLNMESDFAAQWSCALCPAKFSQKEYLDEHNIKFHTADRPFSCALCSARFNQKINLTVHLQKKHAGGRKKSDMKPSVCIYCNSKFSTNFDLRLHLQKHVQENSFLSPPAPNNALPSEIFLISTKSKDNFNIFPCIGCSRTFRYYSSLKFHYKKHCGKKSSRSLVCSAGFRSQSESQSQPEKNLNNYLQSPNSKKPTIEKPFSCTVCSSKFRIRSHLLLHSKKHVSKESLSCPQCSCTFLKQERLEHHMKKHREKQPLRCPHCPARFERKRLLQKHIEILHLTQECHYCYKKFSSEASLSAHLREHTHNTAFACSECSKKFKTKVALLDHLRIHSGEKPFACPYCPKMFRQVSHLKIHEMRHTGERPFTCPLCPAKFIQKAHLLAHANAHSNTGPFSCTHCSSQFKLKLHLTRHLKLHFPEEKRALTTTKETCKKKKKTTTL